MAERRRASATPLVAAAVLALCVAGARADDAVRLSLAQALEAAAAGNPDLAASRERARAAEAQAEAAGRARWPLLTASSEWARSDTPARVFAWKLDRGEFGAGDFAIERLNRPDATSQVTTAAAVEAAVDVFGKTAARARSAAAGGRSGKALHDESTQDLRLRVVEAYRRLALAQAAVAATARAAEGARAREADADAEVRAGAALEAELLRARARRRQREAELAGRRGDVRMAQASLARLIGAPLGTPYQAIDDAPTSPPALADEPEAWARRAVAARGAVVSARERLESARWAERAERRSFLPDVAAYGQIQDERGSLSRSGQVSGSVGLALRWVAFDPARGKRLAAAASDALAAEAEARAAEEQVKLEVELASRRLAAAREWLAAASGGSAEGREALRVMRERRRAGRATLTDELETEAAALAAELDETRAATEAAVAEAALRRAAGEL